MKKNLSLLFFLFSLGLTLKSQQDEIIHSIYLIGDTGKDTIPSEAVQLLAFETFDDSLSTVIFLGDNCYPQGLNPRYSSKNIAIAERKLLSQFEMFVGYRGNFCIIPGNHDWSSGKASGKKAVEAQSALANEWFRKNSIVKNKTQGVFSTKAGFPGPEQYQIDSSITLIFLDSQWWLQSDLFKKVGKLPGKSLKQTRRIAFERLDSMLFEVDRRGGTAVIAAHHPIYSNGKHIHVNEPIRFLINYTPLKLLGWFGLNRYFRQDLPQPRYRRYRKSIEKILSKHSNIIYVSGHEHAMEYFEKDSLHCIVSGSGSKISELDRYRYPAHFMDDLQNGFFRITFHASGKVELHAYGVKDRGEYWKTILFHLPTSH